MLRPKVKLTRSVRKHIRWEKAQIRRQISDPVMQKQKIAELYAKFGVTFSD